MQWVQRLPPHWREMGGALLVLAGAAVLFATAPADGSYWWSDAPRHALNGAFVLDLLRDWPIDDPRAWAVDYYLQYPALTILFYPPLFPLIAAGAYAVLGVSPWAAQLTVSLLGAFAGLGAYAIARRRWQPAAAAGVGLLFLGLPEVALWGRQVMLELPAYAFLLWAAWCLLRYLDDHAPRWLYGAAALFVMALYTKQTVAFVAVAMAVALLAARGGRALVADRHIRAVSGLGLIALVPLVLMTLWFGSVNVQSVTAVQDSPAARWQLASWTYYLAVAPQQVGWPVLVLAVVGLAIAAARWRSHRRGETTLLLAWLAGGYVFFSLISLKEPRLDLFVLFPLVVFAAIAVTRLAGRLTTPALLLLGGTTLLQAAMWNPVPYVDGYARAAAYVADIAEPDSTVLFSGMRDGSFVFNVRSLPRRDLTVLRADKLLLSVAVRRDLGLAELAVDEAGFGDRLSALGVRYVVIEPRFWDDLANMQMLGRVVRSPQFEHLATIPVRSNDPLAESAVEIYRNLAAVAAQPAALTMRLEMIDATLTRSGR